MRWTIQLDTVIVDDDGQLPQVEWLVTLCDFYDGLPIATGQDESSGAAFDKAVRLALFDAAEAAEEEEEDEE